jgi:hypothetical protein
MNEEKHVYAKNLRFTIFSHRVVLLNQHVKSENMPVPVKRNSRSFFKVYRTVPFHNMLYNRYWTFT